MYIIISALFFFSLGEKQTVMASNDQKQESHRHRVCCGFTWRALTVCRGQKPPYPKL